MVGCAASADVVQVAKAPADALHVLEQTTTQVASAIAAASSGQPTGGTAVILAGVRIELPGRTVTVSELQRLKRQFVSVHKKAITLGTIERGGVDWSEERVCAKFVDYIQEHLQ